MKREIFRRGVRMTHQFGDTEKINDPLQTHTFDPPWPKGNRGMHDPDASKPCEVQEYGERGYRPDSSPIQKPGGGFANIDARNPPDMAQDVGMPIPVGTKRRLGPPRTDK